MIESFSVRGGRRDGFTLRSTSIDIGLGDAFVLDPRVPHCAMPKYPSEQCLLVLAQLSFDLKTQADYIRAQRRYPRLGFA